MMRPEMMSPHRMNASHHNPPSPMTHSVARGSFSPPASAVPPTAVTLTHSLSVLSSAATVSDSLNILLSSVQDFNEANSLPLGQPSVDAAEKSGSSSSSGSDSEGSGSSSSTSHSGKSSRHSGTQSSSSSISSHSESESSESDTVPEKLPAGNRRKGKSRQCSAGSVSNLCVSQQAAVPVGLSSVCLLCLAVCVCWVSVCLSRCLLVSFLLDGLPIVVPWPCLQLCSTVCTSLESSLTREFIVWCIY